jgi:hypothetical protein
MTFDMFKGIVDKIDQSCPVLVWQELSDHTWEIIVLRCKASTLIQLLHEAFPNCITKETDDPSELNDDSSNLTKEEYKQAVCRSLVSFQIRTEGIGQYTSPEAAAVYAQCWT